jgi:predicted DsbA family dithiol-disulfide isomerase
VLNSIRDRVEGTIIESTVGIELSAIQVVSDVVCPWCFIGKRRLEKALRLLERKAVQIRWTAFQLNPATPKAGLDRKEYRIRKFGSAEFARQLESRVVEAGREEGIDFQFEKITRIPNTFDAHRLIWLAGREGVQDAVVEGLFRAYFIDAEDVGDTAILARTGAEAGIESAVVERLFGSALGVEEVAKEEEQARRSGVSGVPTFFVNDVPITSGAHQPELLAHVLAPALGPDQPQCSVENETCG